MKQKVVEISQVMDLVKDGMTIMVGGFLACGTPEKLVDAIVEKGVKDITLICNDTGFVDKGVGKWVVNRSEPADQDLVEYLLQQDWGL